MKEVIDAKTYDTDAAEEIIHESSTYREEHIGFLRARPKDMLATLPTVLGGWIVGTNKARTKKSLIALALLAVLLDLSVYSAEAPGRFQLFSTDVSHLLPEGSVVRRELFKIDTVTGETWIFLSYTSTNNVRREWIPIVHRQQGVEGIAGELLEISQVLQWATEHPNGAIQFDERTGQSKRYSPEEVKAIKEAAQKTFDALSATLSRQFSRTNSPSAK